MVAGLVLSVVSPVVSAAGNSGFGIVAGLSGETNVRFPDGTAHQYPNGTAEVEEGRAYSVGHTFQTGEDSSLCVVFSPGGVLCVGNRSSVKLVTLQERTQGLPSSEKDVVRRVELDMGGGEILVYGGLPSPNNQFKVKAGKAVVHSNGSTFEISSSNNGWSYLVREGEVRVELGGEFFVVGEGQIGELKGDSGKVDVRDMVVTDFSKLNEFKLCEDLLPYLDPLVFRVDGVDMRGLADFVGAADGIQLLGDPDLWDDVSPAELPAPRALVSGPVAGKRTEPGRLMPRPIIWNWYRYAGVMKGVNYVPRYAVNVIEMWQESTFGEDIIDEELGWAHDVGFNMLRVPLSFHVWKADPEAFKDRLEAFLEMAEDNHFKTAFILLDDTDRSGLRPALGIQRPPISGVYNSRWTPNPESRYVTDQDKWNVLEEYVRDIVSTYKNDNRILFWDVYQTPGAADLWDKSLPLLEMAFEWVRDEKPEQPLTAGPWIRYGSPMSVRIMELSDFISLQSFGNVEDVSAKLNILRQFDRPIVCTDWLSRPNGSTFEDILPVFEDKRIGWFSRGLVRGKTQLYLPDDRTTPAGEELEIWKQDLLWEDGEVYDQTEVNAIRAFRYAP